MGNRKTIIQNLIRCGEESKGENVTLT